MRHLPWRRSTPKANEYANLDMIKQFVRDGITNVSRGRAAINMTALQAALTTPFRLPAGRAPIRCVSNWVITALCCTLRCRLITVFDVLSTGATASG
jgi:hypothetical protein